MTGAGQLTVPTGRGCSGHRDEGDSARARTRVLLRDGTAEARLVFVYPARA